MTAPRDLLETLSREELLALCRRMRWIDPWDIRGAQIEVADKRWRRAQAAERSAHAVYEAASDAWRSKYSPGREKARRRAFEAAEKARKSEERAFNALMKLYDQKD